MLQSALAELSAQLAHDAAIVGTGIRGAAGEVQITGVPLLHGVEASLVEGYSAVAQYDTCGRMFGQRPDVVQTISVDDMARQASQRPVALYLRQHGIRHLLLGGLESSYGLAWVTLYRREIERPFGLDEAELALYELPTLLHRWQRHHLQPVQPNRHVLPGSSPLTPRELQATLMHVQGVPNKVAASRLGLSQNYVQELIKTSRRKLGIYGRKLVPEDIL